MILSLQCVCLEDFISVCDGDIYGFTNNGCCSIECFSRRRYLPVEAV